MRSPRRRRDYRRHHDHRDGDDLNGRWGARLAGVNKTDGRGDRNEQLCFLKLSTTMVHNQPAGLSGLQNLLDARLHCARPLATTYS